MSTHDRRVENQVLHVGLTDEVLMESREDVAVAPAGETLVDGVPVTVSSRQEPPLRAGAGDPEHGLKEAAALGFVADINLRG